MNKLYKILIHFVAFRLRFIVFSFLILGGCKKSSDFITKWKKVNSLYTGYIADFCFISKDTGFVLGAYIAQNGNTVIQKTFDGGENWVTDTILTGEKKSHITTLAYYNHVLYAGGFIPGASTMNRTYSSTDYGHSWKIIDTTFIRGANMIFLNSADILLSSFTGIYKSTNGGNSFKQVYSDPLNLGFSIIQFPDQNTGFAGGGISFDGNSISTMAKTTDGGNSWMNITSTALPKIITMQFFNNNKAYVFVYDVKGDISHTTYSDYKLFHTTDGANTWNLIRDHFQSDFGNITSSYFKDENNGYISTEKSIFSTLDGGRNWIKEFDAGSVISQGIILSGLYSPPSNHLFAFSTDGSIYKRLE